MRAYYQTQYFLGTMLRRDGPSVVDTRQCPIATRGAAIAPDLLSAGPDRMLSAFGRDVFMLSCGSSRTVPGSAIALIILVAGCAPAPRAETPPPFTPVGTVAQVMEGIVFPSSAVVFDAAVWSNGVLEGAPATEEDWHHVEDSALTVAEAGNLLMMSPRAKDTGEWMKRATALNAAATVAFKAAEARDIDALFNAGSEVYAACANCHRQYRPAPDQN